ncbi:MAG: hypothetical protein ACXVZV_05180 [Terriglobales bacterium]
MKRPLLRALFVSSTVLLLVGFILIRPKPGYAIPAFARQYGTSCSTCHLDFPKLNDFGKAFKDAGFKFPKDDEAMIKIPPVMLGAPAQKELWPKSIWPGTIPGMPPISLRMNSFFQVTGRNANNFVYVPTPGTTTAADPGYVPRTDFQSGLFSVFTAGNFGSDIAFWVDEDFSVGGSNSAGGLGDGYLRFVNIGRFLHLPKDSLNLRVGQFELELPFSPARSWNISGWDIFDQANVGAMNALYPQQNVNNAFALSNAMQGVEISGGHHYGGYYYSLAVVNQNTGGPINGGTFVPPVVAYSSDSNFKDLYGSFTYRFNLERDKESRNAIQAAGPMGPRNHTYLSLGSFYFYGRSVQRFVGATPLPTSNPALLTAREPFYRVGADFSFNYRDFNLFGVWMYGRDHNLVPVDDAGTPFPTTPVAFVHGVPATFSGGFLQADYLAYPWLMLIMRYDGVNSSSDYINGLAGNISSPFFGPISNTRNRFTPGVQFLIHANIKTSFEYQIRPKQQIANGIDPLTGAPVTIPPFRTNAAVVALEYVY